jgi:hypothetical protein
MFLLDEFDFYQSTHARKRGGRNAGSGRRPIPFEASGKGSDDALPEKAGATIISTGNKTPQARMHTSAGCVVSVMPAISQCDCPVGQTFAIAIVKPSAITMKLARKSRRIDMREARFGFAMTLAASCGSASGANHKLGSPLIAAGLLPCLASSFSGQQRSRRFPPAPPSGP